MTKEERIAEVVKALESDDQVNTLVDYWWSDTGWCRPRWQRIAEVAVGAWEESG